MPASFAILPEGVLHTLDGVNGQQWRFVRLLHPRTGLPALFHIQKGSVHEVQAVAPVNQRSWMLDQEVVSDGKMLMITSMDPTFLLIPLLRMITPAAGPQYFRTMDDIFEECTTRLEKADYTTPDICRDYATFLAMENVDIALGRICESQDVGENMRVYRYSPGKLTSYLKKKVTHTSCLSLTEQSRSIIRTFAKDGLLDDGKEELLAAARTRMACELVSHYLPSDVAKGLTAAYDFELLDKYLDELSRQETQSIMTTNKSNKSVDSTAVEKKRKTAKGSQGVEKLKKVNTRGMYKLSTFFGKKD